MVKIPKAKRSKGMIPDTRAAEALAGAFAATEILYEALEKASARSGDRAAGYTAVFEAAAHAGTELCRQLNERLERERQQFRGGRHGKASDQADH